MTDRPFQHGDRVLVTDAGLAALRDVMRRATGQEPAPNHHGTVERLMDDGQVLIHFDDGIGAPYPADQVRDLEQAAAVDRDAVVDFAERPSVDAMRHLRHVHVAGRCVKRSAGPHCEETR